MLPPRVLLCTAFALLASAALADEAHLWPSGCEGCLVIDPPAYMGEMLAAFARERAAGGLTVLGPSCRQLGANFARGEDWQSCRFTTASGCGRGELLGRRGHVAAVEVSGFNGANGCSETELRAFQRAGAEAWVRCDDEAGRRLSIDILLTGAVVDLTDPAEVERRSRDHRSSGEVENLQIHPVCGVMVGTRSIEPAEGGTREVIGLIVDRLPD